MQLNRISDPLPALLLLLSGVTGLVDAVSVLGLGKVFTANMTGNIVWGGLSATGLYQFNIVIPTSAPDGDNSLVATYGGFSTQSGVLIFVQH